MEEFDQILSVLEKIEKNNLKDDENIKIWLRQITDKEFSLIGSLSSLLVENIKHKNISTNIILVLRKLLFYEYDSVRSQLVNNLSFIQNLVNYITSNSAEDTHEESYVLLIEVYSSEIMKNYISDKLLECLFDSMIFLKSEDILNGIVILLTKINFDFYEKKNNFLKILQSHIKARLFCECLLRNVIIIKSSKEEYLYILHTIQQIVNETNSKIFSMTDIESFIDFSIHRLESTYTSIIRSFMLKILRGFISSSDYQVTKYKKNSLIDLMDNHIESDVIDNDQKKICEYILNRLKNY